MVFNWHGSRAGLDARGGGGAPVGIDDLRRAGVTHVGVPMKNTGDFDHRNYIVDLQKAGLKIVRTLDKDFNPGLGGRDLGRLIFGWSPRPRAGFWAEFEAALKGPCDGFAWNMEHPILRLDQYPVTFFDRELALEWKM